MISSLGALILFGSLTLRSAESAESAKVTLACYECVTDLIAFLTDLYDFEEFLNTQSCREKSFNAQGLMSKDCAGGYCVVISLSVGKRATALSQGDPSDPYMRGCSLNPWLSALSQDTIPPNTTDSFTYLGIPVRTIKCSTNLCNSVNVCNAPTCAWQPLTLADPLLRPIADELAGAMRRTMANRYALYSVVVVALAWETGFKRFLRVCVNS